MNLRRWLFRSLWILGFSLLLLAWLIIDFLRFGGAFTALPTDTAASCQAIPLTASAEDIQIDRSRDTAYLSLLDRRALVEGNGRDGDIAQLDLTEARPIPRSALSAAPKGFRPHGMALQPSADGSQRLFVISHPPDGSHVIEIFEQPAGQELFDHVASIRDPLFQSPNALVAVDSKRFYVINDSGAAGRFDRIRETLFRTGLSSIVYFDGNEARRVAGGLKSGVGLGISAEGRRIFAAETLGKRITVYERDSATGNLLVRGAIPTPGSPDNIQIDTQGRLWVAVHPKLLDLIRHFGNASHPAPTMILRGELTDTSLTSDWAVVHLNTAGRLSAGSVGAPHGDMLWIGSITESKILRCSLRGDPS